MNGARRRLAAIMFALVIGAVLICAGCSGVPTSSVPQVVRKSQNTAPNSAESPIVPGENEAPTDIVHAFIEANLDADDLHQQAREYLVPKASWAVNTASLVDDLRVEFPPVKNVVTVKGQLVGTLDATGSYNYVPATRFTRQFKLKHSSAGWRISQPQGGLIIDPQDFLNSYRSYKLFFFNQNESRLVPDVRYSATQKQSLANWLLTGLLAGPQAGLQTPAVRRSELPNDPDVARAKVTLAASGPRSRALTRTAPAA